MISLSAALATRDTQRVRTALARCDAAADLVAVEEVLLQAHLFIGFPDVLRALTLWREISGAPAPQAQAGDRQNWAARGARVCETVYGRDYTKLRHNVTILHPDVDEWMVTGGYGRVIGRPGLDLPTRELCIVALLAVWGAAPQLHSHLRGALNAGALPSDVDAALAVACSFLGAEEAEQVRQLWTGIRARRDVLPAGAVHRPAHLGVREPNPSSGG